MPDLADGLKDAKSKRMYFALVMKGSNDGALIVSKTKIQGPAIVEAKKQSGGSAVVQGFCQGEDGKYIFLTAKDAPATAAQAVKTIAKRDATLTVSAEFRVSNDPELLTLDGDAVQTATQLPPTAKPPAQPTTEAKARAQPTVADATTRLNALGPDLKAALAGPNKAKVQARYAAITALIAKGQGVEAGKEVDGLADWLKLNAELTKQLNAMTPDIKAAMAGPNKVKIQILLTSVSKQINGDQPADAVKGLEDLRRLVTAGASNDGNAAANGKKVSPAFPPLWKQATAVWQDAVDTVNTQLEKLRSALINFDDKKYPELADLPAEAKNKIKQQLKSVAESGLSKVVDGQRVALQTAIGNVNGAADDAGKQKFIGAAQTIVANVRSYVASSEIVEVCDDNGMDVQVTIRQSLGDALKQMDEALGKAFVS